MVYLAWNHENVVHIIGVNFNFAIIIWV